MPRQEGTEPSYFKDELYLFTERKTGVGEFGLNRHNLRAHGCAQDHHRLPGLQAAA